MDHEKPLEDAMEKLKIDSPSKNNNLDMTGPKDASSSDAASCISSGDAASRTKESQISHEISESDQGMYYYGYYYPGFNGMYGEWDAQNLFMGPGGFEIQQPASKDETGSFVYCFPGIQAGYVPYSPFLPGNMIGVDGEYLAHQSYNPNPISSQPLVSPGLYPQHFAYTTEMLPSYPLDPSLVFLDGFQGNTLNVNSTIPQPKAKFSSHHHKFRSTSPASLGASDLKGSSPASQNSSVQNQPHKHVNKGSNAMLSKGYLPVNKPSMPNQGKNGRVLYQNSSANMLENSFSWSTSEKLKARHKLNDHGDQGLLNEQNLGPRKNVSKNSSESGADLADSPNAEKSDDGSGSIALFKKNEYNHPDFETKYEHAYFFVIKSFSEDDIHKSIKYNVWTSTPNGNKRLDNAFQMAQEKIAENGSKCPVFLFFSVNASGQFCGVAEMIGRVDFNKNMDFWQQDKWNGNFPVKWHLIKDIPNPVLRHIILENNDNKPVTNSRDTQEVKFPQGTEMLNIFKTYSSKTSILDDFDFYEERQKAMQDKRNKPLPNFLHLLPKVTSDVIQNSKIPTMRR